MAQQPMPVGQPFFFEGDIRAIEPLAYGFFYCEIVSPAYLEHPILQRRIKTSEGTRTIAGLGSWTGWICSAEMDNAVKFGYTFKIIRGYQFETGDLFSKFVSRMYELRQEYPKGHPMNQTAKLMVNSLYGKFGMRSEFTRVDIYAIKTEEDKVLFRELLDIWGTTVKDFILLDNQLIVLRDSRVDIRNTPEDSDNYHGVEANIAVASAITANARIHMSIFKNNPDFNLYYSDTDSVFTDKELPENMVGKGLGQVKLEYVNNKAVFLAPKVYALETDDKTIIKVKGLTHDQISKLSFNDIEALLVKDSSREFNQEKWFKNLLEGEISINNQIYTLKQTSNKREHIYLENVFSSTKPYNYMVIEKAK
jgi:hypothetical protein